MSATIQALGRDTLGGIAIDDGIPAEPSYDQPVTQITVEIAETDATPAVAEARQALREAGPWLYYTYEESDPSIETLRERIRNDIRGNATKTLQDEIRGGRIRIYGQPDETGIAGPNGELSPHHRILIQDAVAVVGLLTTELPFALEHQVYRPSRQHSGNGEEGNGVEGESNATEDAIRKIDLQNRDQPTKSPLYDRVTRYTPSSRVVADLSYAQVLRLNCRLHVCVISPIGKCTLPQRHRHFYHCRVLLNVVDEGGRWNVIPVGGDSERNFQACIGTFLQELKDADLRRFWWATGTAS